MNVSVCRRSSEAAGEILKATGLPGSRVDLALYRGKNQIVVLTRADLPPAKLKGIKGIRKARTGFHPSHLPAYIFHGSKLAVVEKLKTHFFTH